MCTNLMTLKPQMSLSWKMVVMSGAYATNGGSSTTDLERSRFLCTWASTFHGRLLVVAGKLTDTNIIIELQYPGIMLLHRSIVQCFAMSNALLW